MFFQLFYLLFVFSVVFGIAIYVYSLVLQRSKKFQFHKELVLITGGASGIGRILSKKFVASGNSVVLLDIDDKALKSSLNELNELKGKGEQQILTFKCDISNPKEVEKSLQDAQKQAERDITVVVNNAGIVNGKALLDLSPEEIQRSFGVNSMGHFWTIQQLLPNMIKNNRGLVVTVASVMGLSSSARLTDYCASKWAACGMHEALRLELRNLKADGVRTLLVCPFAIDTGMFDGVFESEKQNKFLKQLFPLLNPIQVVDQIYQAMHNGDQALIGCSDVLWHSFLYRWIFHFIHMLPVPVMDFIAETAGGVHGMDSFRGRKESKKSI